MYSAARVARICRLGLRFGAFLLPGLLVLAVAGPARVGRAQANPGPAPQAAAADGDRGDAQATARAHFEAATQHYRARRYREAIHEFEQSASRVPNAEVWFDIGRAHEQLGEYELAIASYQRYLRDRVDAPDADEVTGHIEVLRARAPATGAATVTKPRSPRGSLAVDAGQPGAIVLLDGRSLGVGPIDRILEIEPGPHRLEASRAGYIPFRAAVDVQDGGLSAAYVDMQPLTRGHDDAPPRVWTWIAAGASAVAIGTAAGCGLGAIAARDDGAATPASERWTTAANVALVGALTFAIGATLLYFVESAGEPARESPQ